MTEGGLTPLHHYRTASWATRYWSPMAIYSPSPHHQGGPGGAGADPPRGPHRPLLPLALGRLEPRHPQLLCHQDWTGTCSKVVSFHHSLFVLPFSALQVVLSSLASVTPIPRSLLAAPQEDRPVCNLQCFMDWKQQVGAGREGGVEV